MTDFMTNAQGHMVPIDKVKGEDKLENDLVLSMIAKAKDLSSALSKFKSAAFSDVNTFQVLLGEKYGAKRGGQKGNLTLLSYDGLFKVVIAVNDFLQFGPQLQVAKDLIDECINDWSEGSRSEIRVLVNHAFRVDKNNRVNTDAILGLRRLDITHDKWKRAMDAITDSIRVTHSKQYVRFYERPAPDAEWQSVNLDIAKVGVPS